MKGIILAAGKGTRLYPLTQATSKSLLPIYDKPMIYYPLSTLMLAGIREILLITTAQDQPAYNRLLGNGQQWGIHLTYAIQDQANGIAEAFIIGESFIKHDCVCLALGDNLLYGQGISKLLQEATQLQSGAHIFGYYVDQPQRYGVLAFGPNKEVLDIIEKPTHPPSHYAVPGIYFYDHTAIAKAKSLRPSARGELEITEINQLYLHEKRLRVTCLQPGIAWLDTGQADALLQASDFIAIVEQRQGLKIGCVEEVAFRKGFIDCSQLENLAKSLQNTAYGAYLSRIATTNYEDY